MEKVTDMIKDALEVISTQNGPPTKNNKIMFNIIKKYLLILEEEKKKTTFFVRIFDISHCVFTQISIGRARWM